MVLARSLSYFWLLIAVPASEPFCNRHSFETQSGSTSSPTERKSPDICGARYYMSHFMITELPIVSIGLQEGTNFIGVFGAEMDGRKAALWAWPMQTMLLSSVLHRRYVAGTIAECFGCSHGHALWYDAKCASCLSYLKNQTDVHGQSSDCPNMSGGTCFLPAVEPRLESTSTAGSRMGITYKDWSCLPKSQCLDAIGGADSTRWPDAGACTKRNDDDLDLLFGVKGCADGNSCFVEYNSDPAEKTDMTLMWGTNPKASLPPGALKQGMKQVYVGEVTWIPCIVSAAGAGNVQVISFLLAMFIAALFVR